jgi:branched-chain amino acid transport system ATP-binding protein
MRGAATLYARGLTVDFGGVRALDGVSFDVEPSKISSLIGPNGSGKTTTFNVLTGFQRQHGGVVQFGEDRVDHLPAYRVAQRGIVRTFQQARVFAGVTVLECVVMGAHLSCRAGFLQVLARTARIRKLEEQARARALEILDFLGLRKPHELAGALPYGEQKMLEIGIALAAGPSLLLLDEPASGMIPEEHKRLNEILRRIVARGTTILLVEHNMSMVMDISHRIFVLNFGKKIAEGTPGEIGRDPAVIKAYLGEGYKSYV